jgi:D-cysteine desulfhydrase family pyridoxal phosphate-dependent enzyme
MINLPRVKIAHLPTPLEPMSRLSNRLGGPNLFVKRDDLTGLALGGNKTRKLEYLIAEAQANGARTLITAGAAQSNHCRQTAAAAARYGFACILILTGEEPQILESNTLLDRLLGAQIIWTTRQKRDEVLQSTFESSWDSGQRPYLIPYGGSNAIGAIAYAQAFLELHGQMDPFDWVVFATSSGGTQAGLAVGAQIANWKGCLLGISVDETESILKVKVDDLVQSASTLIGLGIAKGAYSNLINDNYIGAGYAIMDKPEAQAIRLFAEQEALLLDPVYTGRAAAGMLDLIHQGIFKKGESIVFWHTGGTPALFANQYTTLLQ